MESGRVSLNRFRRAVTKVRILNHMAKASSSFGVRKSSEVMGNGLIQAVASGEQQLETGLVLEGNEEGKEESKEEAKEA